MSERDFDIYLSLLAKLLRLSSGQRESIEAELRDHLEERLDELLGKGLTKEQAIATALEEFGDAAGLAQRFTLLATQHRRRLIMRYSVASLCALGLTAAMVMSILPERHDVPVQALVQAESQERPKPAPRGDAGALSSKELAEARLDQILPEVVYDQFPFREVFRALRETADVNIIINKRAVEEAGLDLEQPITLHVTNVPASAVLRLVLDQAGGDLNPLDYTVNELGIVEVSTVESLSRNTVVRTYDIRDLTEYDDATIPRKRLEGLLTEARALEQTLQGDQLEGTALAAKLGADLARLIDGLDAVASGRGADQLTVSERTQNLVKLIEGSIAPDSWRARGGIVGNITEVNGILFIRTTHNHHQEIAELLGSLRDFSKEPALAAPPKAAEGFGAPGGFPGGFRPGGFGGGPGAGGRGFGRERPLPGVRQLPGVPGTPGAGARQPPPTPESEPQRP